MQSRILCREKPRSIVLRPLPSQENNNPLVLLFEQATQNSYSCNVRLLRESEINLEEYRILNQKPIHGCLGILQVEDGILNFVLLQSFTEKL